MTTWRGSIDQATHRDASAATQVLATSFMTDPVSRWIFPDDDERARCHRHFFAPFVTLALATGEVHLTDDRSAVALWLPVPPTRQPPDGHPDPHATLGAALPRGPLDRFGLLDGLMTAAHPERPHWYLPFVAVHPDRHGEGIGTALLTHHLAHLDRTGSAAYLEASSARNARLYRRLGFREAGAPLVLPDGPSLLPMWRPPA